MIGLLSGAVTAYFTLHHQFMKGAACFAFHQLLDATDGTMARRFNMCSPFGAMLDATCDQISGALLTITGIYVRLPLAAGRRKTTVLLTCRPR